MMTHDDASVMMPQAAARRHLAIMITIHQVMERMLARSVCMAATAPHFVDVVGIRRKMAPLELALHGA